MNLKYLKGSPIRTAHLIPLLGMVGSLQNTSRLYCSLLLRLLHLRRRVTVFCIDFDSFIVQYLVSIDC